MHIQIGPFQSSKGGRSKVKVKVRLNLHGIVSVESATVSHLLVFPPYFVSLIFSDGGISVGLAVRRGGRGYSSHQGTAS